MKKNPFRSQARLIRVEEHGKKLIRELLHPDNGFGGHLTLITGPIGSGKTSLILALARAFADSGFTVVFRGREAFEIYRLPKWREKTLIFVPKNHKIRFIEHDHTTKELNIPYEEYENIGDLLQKIKPGKINLVFHAKEINEKWFKPHFLGEDVKEAKKYIETIWWLEFFDKLIKKLASRKVVVIIDEAHELFPSSTTGLLWRLLEFAKSKIADFRKYKKNLILATHDPSDLDWRINRKFDYAIYLRGAKTLKRLVWQRYTYKLDDDGAFIEGPSEFGIIHFKKLPEKRIIIAQWKRTKTRANWEEREEKHLKAIKEVAIENNGLFKRELVREKLGSEFHKLVYDQTIRELVNNGKARSVGRGVYWLNTG